MVGPDRAPIHPTERWIPCNRDGALERIPAAVHVDAARLRDVLKYWRSPIILGPGKGSQWRVGPHFDVQARESLRGFNENGIMAIPRDAWVDKLDLKGWHAVHNNHSKLTLAKELVRAVQLRTLLAVPQSLASQDMPFRHLVIIPVTEENGF